MVVSSGNVTTSSPGLTGIQEDEQVCILFVMTAFAALIVVFVAGGDVLLDAVGIRQPEFVRDQPCVVEDELDRLPGVNLEGVL